MPNEVLTSSFNIENNTVAKSFTTFSGSDIKAAFNEVEIGNLQGLSISVNREVRPIFVMGRTDALSYSRGKRGIAGSIVLTTLDRHALGAIVEQAKIFKYSNQDTAQQQWQSGLRQTAGTLAGYGLETPTYTDELPPFTITLVARNEFGNAMKMTIRGVILISEGTGVSVDDAMQESQLTFVSTGVKWWERLSDNPTQSVALPGGSA